MGYAEKCRDDFTDKIEHSYTFIERREWVNRRSWPRKTIGHRGLSSIFRSLAIRSRLPLGTFVGNVILAAGHGEIVKVDVAVLGRGGGQRRCWRGTPNYQAPG